MYPFCGKLKTFCYFGLKNIIYNQSWFMRMVWYGMARGARRKVEARVVARPHPPRKKYLCGVEGLYCL